MFIVQGISNAGKTTILRELYTVLKEKYGIEIISENIRKSDITTIFKLNNIKIGIESEGDQGHLGSRLDTSLKEFEKVGCDIILCAARTKGATVRRIHELKSTYTLQFIKKEKIDKNNINEIKRRNLEVIESLMSKII